MNKEETWYKKPVAIKAKQMDEPFKVKTLEGVMKGKAGDFLVTGIRGEQYPVDKEIFEVTYTKKQPPSTIIAEFYHKKSQRFEKLYLDCYKKVSNIVSKETDVWIFEKEGFLSVAQNEDQKEKMKKALKIKPQKAKIIFFNGVEKMIDPPYGWECPACGCREFEQQEDGRKKCPHCERIWGSKRNSKDVG